MLLSSLIFCFIFATITFYMKENTTRYYNREVYIYAINESEICVKGLPTSKENFNESYIIKNTDSLKIFDRKGGNVDYEILKEGNILIFDFKSILTPKANSYLNRGMYNIRLSDEVFNNKFWNSDF